MQPKNLIAHKKAAKALTAMPAFRPQARNRLPPPFKKLGGPRMHSTGFLDVSDAHAAIFFWRDGPALTDRLFLAYLFCKLHGGDLSPVFEFHWHPSHKGFHCKTPCRTASNYTNRTLPGAPELNIKTESNLDPRNAAEREELVRIACRACGITLPPPPPENLPLWSSTT